MARTILLFLLPAFLVATHWPRLEESGGTEGRFLWVAALALAPALVRPLWARGARAASSPRRSRSGSRSASRSSTRGRSPARTSSRRSARGCGGASRPSSRSSCRSVPRDRPAMHGAILLAVFAFCVVLALAIAARRPLLASAALIAGAGWPATLLPGRAELERGAIILAAALLLFAGMRSLPTLDLRQPLLAGAAVVLAAVVVSTSRRWPAASSSTAGAAGTSRAARARPSASSTSGTRTTPGSGSRRSRRRSSRSARTSRRASYWRATTLDLFTRAAGSSSSSSAPSRSFDGDAPGAHRRPVPPAEAQVRDTWLRADVRSRALRDTHLIGAGRPGRLRPGRPARVDYYLGNVAIAAGGNRARRLVHGLELRAEADAAAARRGRRADYPAHVTEPYLARRGDAAAALRGAGP